ncbi:beta-glucoside operon transcriptional antiterminator [Microbacterium halimionae]|uniref:Beta-glucoside operon transcriptional antiterminator n=1 Tax=Microbacterium halimionae TaxID=1526413 RepID=A0A7W3JLV0_9MICO|nr:PRD domain-containing protein [Microbacterium halimionae]MBA8815089.1 beta-glucoside operon transcriptional antiterminator [Microbacterium halimionae]NII94120.1 beta-glucoside operon transcriptional antiterminator [Microbacterium halimionae]
MPADRDAAGARATIAHKVLNNNVVVSVDENGHERVLMGRGLGFQLRPQDTVDPAKVEKTFVLDDGTEGEQAQRLLADAPYPLVEAVTSAVDEAERILGRDLGRRIVVAIIDHIQFVLERIQKGIQIPATRMPELRVLHPQEFAAATHMSASIGASLDTALPDEEAVFLTMHVLNATRDEPNGTAALLFRRVQHVVSTVENGLGIDLNPESPDYARFILHVQFLLQRLVSESMLRGNDSSFFEFAKRSYPRSYEIAKQVKSYVREATGSALTDEELLYVIVHVERLSSHVQGGESDGAVVT